MGLIYTKNDLSVKDQERINSRSNCKIYTFDMVIDILDKKLTLDMIKEWHGSLMFRTRLYDMGLAGVFKKYQNKILGANFDAANPWEVEDKLDILIKNLYLLEKVTLDDIARFHLEFELIHPFQDDNGRIERFIYLKQLLDNRLELKYMNYESAEEYKKDFIVENKNMF